MAFKISGFADEIDQSLDVQIDSLNKLGVSYVEMRGVDGNNLIYHSDEKVKEIKRKIDGNGIALSALGSPLGKIGIEDDFEKHFEEFKRAIEVGHMMDCNRIRMFSFYIPEGKAVNEYEAAVFDRIGRFIDYAKSNDAVLLHENEKGIYGEKAHECKKLMDEFYSDNFKAIFDFANFVQAQENTLEAYELLKDYIAYIHVKDAILSDGHVVPAGFGDGNVEAILNKLKERNFDGFLSLEPHLFNFPGFANLEKDGKSIKVNSGNEVLTGFEAFSLAHEALLRLI